MSQTKLFILDTNVLMHDPMALFNFENNDIFLPMTVLEELDANKKGMSEVARNAREANRLIDEIIDDADFEAIKAGLPLERIQTKLQQINQRLGKLYFETESLQAEPPAELPTHKADNHIILTGLALQKRHPKKSITLVTKDINMRVKASTVGLHSEDYYNDRVVEDADLLYRGWEQLPEDFFSQHVDEMKSWQDNEGHTFYQLHVGEGCDWYPNECLISKNDSGFSAIVKKIEPEDKSTGKIATLQLLNDYTQKSIWGITARNQEQNMALNVLMDPDIDFVSLLGAAGTGKTLLTLAAALHQTLDDNLYNEIIMTRATIPIAEDIGFLPGTEEEKMTPWMGALMDNLEVLTQTDDISDWEKSSTQDLLSKRIKIKSMNFMRGRTFQNKFIIIDEAQNLTPKQMKTLITRAGIGTKMVCLGNLSQIDSPYLTETTTGLTYIVDRFKTWEHSAHITLIQGERSRLAEFASNTL